MPLKADKLANLQDSTYAAELQKQPSTLRFPAALENEYFDEHLRRVQVRARIWTAIALLLAVGFSIETWARERGTVDVLAHLFLILPIAGLMAWLAWSPGHMRGYMRVTRLLAPVLGFSVAVAVAQAITVGAAEELASLMLLLIATFFFLGLMFRAAVIAGLSILAGFAIAGPLFGMAMPLFLKSFLFLLTGAAAGIAICRDVERSYRKRFLEQSLINELIDRDPLTGLKNRRAFDDHVTRVWQQCLRTQSQLAFLMIDIDYFKNYNDRYGHQAGDTTLRRVAATVQDFARRPLDIAARYGGEEFVVVIYDISPEAVREIAEGLRERVEKLAIEHADSACGTHLTVSIGVSIVRPAIGRTPKGGLQLADEALYQAKESGRNRCVMEGQAEYEALVTGRYRNPAAAGRP